LRAAYGRELPSGIRIFGPYVGELGNGLQKLALIDRNGFIEDYIEYDDNHGWPAAAGTLSLYTFLTSQTTLVPPGTFYLRTAHSSLTTINSLVVVCLSLVDLLTGLLIKVLLPTRASYFKAWNWRAELATPGKSNLDSDMLPVIVDVDTSPKGESIRADSRVKVTASLRPMVAVG
jgi:hypothetical protein